MEDSHSSVRAGHPQGQAPNPNGLWAQTDINVAGRDLTNVALTLQTGMTITGRVAFEGTKPPPTDLSKMTIPSAWRRIRCRSDSCRQVP